MGDLFFGQARFDTGNRKSKLLDQSLEVPTLGDEVNVEGLGCPRMVAHPLGDLGHARGLGEAERRRGEEEQTLFAHDMSPFP